jgi:hypothetical protein
MGGQERRLVRQSNFRRWTFGQGRSGIYAGRGLPWIYLRIARGSGRYLNVWMHRSVQRCAASL